MLNRIPIIILVSAIIISLLPSSSRSQEVNSSALRLQSGTLVYEKIETVDLSKKEIISFVNSFLAENFKSSKSVIELRDDELGRLVGDIVLNNADAGFFDGFKAIKTRIIIDAKDGKYRFQATNIMGIDGNGKVSPWGQIEGANRYRLEPLALQVLPPFAAGLKAYLNKGKSSRDF